MLRVLAALVALALLAPAAAEASRMPRPPQITIHEDTPCPFHPARSCAVSINGDVYLAPEAPRHEREHEIGHIFDAQVLTDRSRAWFTSLFGYAAGTPWFNSSGEYSIENHRRQPGEVFAEAYADCALGWAPPQQVVRQRRGKNGLRIVNVTERGRMNELLTLTPRQHRRACGAIVVAALVRA